MVKTTASSEGQQRAVEDDGTTTCSAALAEACACRELWTKETIMFGQLKEDQAGFKPIGESGLNTAPVRQSKGPR